MRRKSRDTREEDAGALDRLPGVSGEKDGTGWKLLSDPSLAAGKSIARVRDGLADFDFAFYLLLDPAGYSNVLLCTRLREIREISRLSLEYESSFHFLFVKNILS